MGWFLKSKELIFFRLHTFGDVRIMIGVWRLVAAAARCLLFEIGGFGLASHYLLITQVRDMPIMVRVVRPAPAVTRCFSVDFKEFRLMEDLCQLVPAVARCFSLILKSLGLWKTCTSGGCSAEPHKN
jgi:hypothetical protein